MKRFTEFLTTVIGFTAIVQSHAIFTSGGIGYMILGAILGALGIALIKSEVKQ